MYRVAKASEYLVITGVGIRDIKLAKKGWVLPGQSCTVFDLSPVNYTFEVQAMSAEKLPFILPAVFTIGPRVDDDGSLLRYAKLLSSHDKLSHHVKELVQGIIEGETRVLAASMTMEDIFRGTKSFKQEVFEKVQLELNQFGLLIYNANVKQLVDVAGHEYFSYLGQKTQMEAANQAKVDVAEAKMKGEVGAKLREGQTQQNAAKIDAETKIISTQRHGEGVKEDIKVKTEVKVFENEREAVVAEANSELAKKKAMWAQTAQVAEVEATKAVALREAELQREVERMNALTRTEKLKAEFLSKASVEYETKVSLFISPSSFMQTIFQQYYIPVEILKGVKKICLTIRYKKRTGSCTGSRKQQKQYCLRRRKRQRHKKLWRRQRISVGNKQQKLSYLQRKRRQRDFWQLGKHKEYT